MRLRLSLAAIALVVGAGAVACTFTVDGVTVGDQDLSASEVDLAGEPDLRVPDDLTVAPADLTGVDLIGFDLSTPPDMTVVRDMTTTPPDMTDLAPQVDMTPVFDMVQPVDLGSTLLVQAKTMPLSGNFTTEGTLDWVHYGLGGTASTRNEKSGATEIGALTTTGNFRQFGSFLRSTSWTDGSPTMSTTDTNTGVYTNGSFTITANATTTTRILRVYAVIYMATGHLTVTLPGEPTFTLDRSSASATGDYVIFEITYRATSNQTLTVKLENSSTGSASADVDFLGATLTTAP